MYRAAHRWRKEIEIAQASSHQLAGDYMEVHYESLIGDVVLTLNEICEFLDCEFSPNMTTLNAPVENLGDTKGRIEIVADNSRKFATRMKPRDLRRIEEIAYPAMVELGYDIENNFSFKEPTSLMLNYWKLCDGWAILRSTMKGRSVFRSAKLMMWMYLKSSWR